MDAKTLRALRIAKGYSRQQLANEIGMSYASIAHAELGSRRITENFKTRLAQAVEVDDEIAEKIRKTKKFEETLA